MPFDSLSVHSAHWSTTSKYSRGIVFDVGCVIAAGFWGTVVRYWFGASL